MKRLRKHATRAALWMMSAPAYQRSNRNRTPDTSDADGRACETKTRPVVFVHGFLELGDAFAAQSMRFAANGYDTDLLHAFDWNCFGNTVREGRRLATFIDKVLRKTGSRQVDLIGHSVGCMLCRYYMKSPVRAEKVAHYVHIAGGPSPNIAWGTKTLTLSSTDDPIVGQGHIPRAENITLPGHDHLRIATSPESFLHMYTFFNDGKKPETTELQPDEDIVLSGRLLTFAQNRPAQARALKIFRIDPESGTRLDPEPVAVFRSDREGRWGPFRAAPGQHYEYEIPGSHRMKPLHYYREPLVRSCHLVYFRVFPPLTSPVGSLLFLATKLLPKAMYLATLNINQAVIHGRDDLRVNGVEVSTKAFAEAGKNTLTIFYTDFPFISQGKGLFVNRLLPFIQTVDLQIGPKDPAPVKLEYNGRSIAVPRRPVETGGVTIVVFE